MGVEASFVANANGVGVIVTGMGPREQVAFMAV